ncbi:hypothetical protein [Carboxylicivirga caseinilyticus]|uniref:PGAP1-like alpha/beta domain-containing protein n=1 Tax=Carboxylicivirga caseinilyticus TaxID=3417572 RepID=UPI003D344385|nr:hypothetical protein [Marinilabiliaceae bacterium A049]
MKKIIIGIHGLGNKPPKYLLEKWWLEAMEEGLINSEYKSQIPTFELVYWADILYEMPLDYWMKDISSSYYLDEPYIKSSGNKHFKDTLHRKNLNARILEFFNSVFLKKDKTQKHRFISDFIIQKYFFELEVYYSEKNNEGSDFNFKAKRLIQKRLYSILHKYKGYDIMLVAHSMGSIIAFDVLSKIHPITINTFITIGSPLGFPIVISEIAKEKERINLESNLIKSPDCIQNKWYNQADLLDKVAINHNLSEIYEPNKSGIKPIDILVSNDYQVNGQLNPHKSFGYLRTPEFSSVLRNFISDNSNELKNQIIGTDNQIKFKADKSNSNIKLV